MFSICSLHDTVIDQNDSISNTTRGWGQGVSGYGHNIKDLAGASGPRKQTADNPLGLSGTGNNQPRSKPSLPASGTATKKSIATPVTARTSATNGTTPAKKASLGTGTTNKQTSTTKRVPLATATSNMKAPATIGPAKKPPASTYPAAKKATPAPGVAKRPSSTSTAKKPAISGAKTIGSKPNMAKNPLGQKG